MPWNNATRELMRAAVRDRGVDAVAAERGIRRESVRRACRRAADSRGPDQCNKPEEVAVDAPAVLTKIAERYTDKELLALAHGALPQADFVRPIHDFTGRRLRIGVLSDTHLGSKYTNPDFVKMAFDEFARYELDMVTVSGDVTEGLSRRDGHVYECTHVGFAAQKEHAVDVFGQWTDTPIYMIDGNHDRWFTKIAGAHIVQDICDELPNAEYLGEDEGDIYLSPTCVLKLWHGEDGSSYATSYRLQKLIESFTGGEKPAALFAGHVHKQGYFFIRHVHCLGAGAVQTQSKWMRSKRLAAHAGFHIVELVLNDKGIASFRPEWFPFYV